MSNAECRSLAAADDYEFDKPITVFPHWFIMNNLLTCAVQEYFIDHDPHRITSPEVGYLNELMSMIGAPIIVPFDNLDNPDRPGLENIYVGHIHASSRGFRLKKSKLAEQAKLGVDTRCYTYRELSACSPTIPFATSFMQHPGSSSGIAADAMALSMLPKARAEIALIQERDKSFYRIFHMITHRNVVLEKIQAHE